MNHQKKVTQVLILPKKILLYRCDELYEMTIHLNVQEDISNITGIIKLIFLIF